MAQLSWRFLMVVLASLGVFLTNHARTLHPLPRPGGFKHGYNSADMQSGGIDEVSDGRRSGDERTPLCSSYEEMLTGGQLEDSSVGGDWKPAGCRLAQLEESLPCFRGKRWLFLGDSMGYGIARDIVKTLDTEKFRRSVGCEKKQHTALCFWTMDWKNAGGNGSISFLKCPGTHPKLSAVLASPLAHEEVSRSDYIVVSWGAHDMGALFPQGPGTVVERATLLLRAIANAAKKGAQVIVMPHHWIHLGGKDTPLFVKTAGCNHPDKVHIHRKALKTVAACQHMHAFDTTPFLRKWKNFDLLKDGMHYGSHFEALLLSNHICKDLRWPSAVPCIPLRRHVDKIQQDFASSGATVGCTALPPGINGFAQANGSAIK